MRVVFIPCYKIRFVLFPLILLHFISIGNEIRDIFLFIDYRKAAFVGMLFCRHIFAKAVDFHDIGFKWRKLTPPLTNVRSMRQCVNFGTNRVSRLAARHNDQVQWTCLIG